MIHFFIVGRPGTRHAGGEATISDQPSGALHGELEMENCHIDDVIGLVEQKEEIINSLLDSSYDGIFIIDKNARIIYLSKAIERITGLKPEKVKGKRIYDLIEKGVMHPDSVSLKVFREKKRLSSLLELKDSIILSTATPYFDLNNNIKFVICNVRDINDLDSIYYELKSSFNKAGVDQNELIISKLQDSLISMGFDDFVINSQEMFDILKLIFSLANFQLTYLITGETGTGKGVIAKIIHYAGKRKSKPLVEINCSAIPQELFESELFGYKEGAFSGARKSGQSGLLESANGGTVFLDEIGAMPLSLQGKLLKFLDDRRIKRLGSSDSIALDIQVVSATNTELYQDVQTGRFRKDLYHRLNEIAINVPPLRDRRKDIEAMVDYYWYHYSKVYNKKASLDHNTMDYLYKYDYPGNVRELKNIIKKIILNFSSGKITVDEICHHFQEHHVPLNDVSLGLEQLSFSETMSNYEKTILQEAYKKYGSTYAAAGSLQMKQSTFYRKAKKYRILDAR